MNLDDRIVSYMKVRNEYAKTAAFMAAAQLYAIAGFLCMYALVAGNVFYSRSAGTVKLIIYVITIVISVGLCVVNVLTCRKSKEVYIKSPDYIAVRSGEEIVREAYRVARPVLIQKITLYLILLPASGVVYIMLRIFLNNEALANIYGKLVVTLAVALFVSNAVPCIDRITCYRILLNEIHIPHIGMASEGKSERDMRNISAGYIVSVAVPLCICIWSILRFYGNRQEIAWIVFPITALLAMAACFLVLWTLEGKAAAGDRVAENFADD